MTTDEIISIIVMSALIGGIAMNLLIEGLFKTILKDLYTNIKYWSSKPSELNDALKEFQSKYNTELANYVKMGLDIKAAEEVAYRKYMDDLKHLAEADPHLKAWLEEQKNANRRSALEHTMNMESAMLRQYMDLSMRGFGAQQQQYRPK